jgi:hypothetical protein
LKEWKKVYIHANTEKLTKNGPEERWKKRRKGWNSDECAGTYISY